MPLESGTYLPDLVASNPAHTDGMNQGDGHLRLIKSVLLNTFKNWTDTSGIGGVGYLSATQGQLDTVAAWAVSQALFPVGSVAAPSIGFTGDTDSGFYKAAEDDIALSLNGTQQVNFTTTGVTFNQAVTAASVSATNYNNGAFVPPGCIMMYQGSTVPVGWAWLNGGTVTSAANPVLNSIYGNSGGTITLPDWRDYVPIGQGTMGGTSDRGLVLLSGIDTMGAGIGETNHTLTVAQLPVHTPSGSIGGSQTINADLHNDALTGSATGGGHLYIGTVDGSITIFGSSFTFSGNSIGSGSSHNNVQLSIVTGYIIKLG